MLPRFSLDSIQFGFEIVSILLATEVTIQPFIEVERRRDLHTSMVIIKEIKFNHLIKCLNFASVIEAYSMSFRDD